MFSEEAGDVNPDIDDTDGLDPAAEFDAWRARELARLLRDKQAQAERDLEQEEIERRRALPEEQRLREDMEFAQSTRDREKGEMGFMQKYYHKGAFHQVCLVKTMRRLGWWLMDAGRRSAQERLYWCNGESSGYFDVTEGYASSRFRKGELELFEMCLVAG